MKTSYKTTDDTIAAEILQYVRDRPGATGADIRAHFHTRSKNTVSSTLGRLRRHGLLENRGRGGRWSEWYPAEHTPVEPMYAEMAHELATELNDIYPVSEREPYLARRLQELFIGETFYSNT